MLYIFDLDDTLIEGYVNTKHPYERVEPMRNRAVVLDTLIQNGDQIAIVTNQGGVAFGKTTEDKFWSKVYDACYKLGLPTDTTVAVCFSDVRGKTPYNDPVDASRRKPSGAMIYEVLAKCPNAARDGVLYVGDRPEDEQAAMDANVTFRWTADFFGDGTAR